MNLRPKETPAGGNSQLNNSETPVGATQGQNNNTKEFSTQGDLEQYNPDQRPPNLKFAIEHQKAKRVAKNAPLTNMSEQQKVCPCCGNQIENQPLDINCNTIDLGFLGAGIPLFFEFTKFCMVISLIIAVISSIYGFAKNISGNGCDNYKDNTGESCPSTAQNYLSTDNRRGEELDETYSLLNLIAVLTMIVYSLRFRKHQEQISSKIDEQNITPSDYTVKVSGYPRDTQQHEIVYHLENCLKPPGQQQGGITLKICKIVMSYDIREYIKLEQERLKYLTAQSKLISRQQAGQSVSDKLIDDYNILIKQVDKRIDEYKNKHKKSGGDADFQFSGTVFVSFQKDKYVDFVENHFSVSSIEYYLQKIFCPTQKGFRKNGQLYTIKVERSSEPTDVNWENLGVSNYEKRTYRFYTIMGSLFAILFSFGFIFLFSYLQFEINESGDESYAAQGLSLIASFIIVFLNGVLGVVIRILSQYEKNSTQTNFYTSVAKKLGFAQFVNTAIVSLVVNAVFNRRYYMVDGGLVSDITYILFVNAVVPPMLNVLNPVHLKKFWLRKQIRQQGEKCTLTQQQVHQIFEGPQYDVAKQYASIMKIMLSSAIFCYLLPIASVISLLALMIFYWQNKYQLLRRNQKPHAIGDQISHSLTTFYIEMIIMVFSIGCIVFEAGIYDSISGWTIANLVIAIVFYIFPIHKLFNDCIQVDRSNSTDLYEDVSPFFTTDFDRENPITAEKATQEWLEKQGLAMSKKEEQSKQQQQGFFARGFQAAQRSLGQRFGTFGSMGGQGYAQQNVQQQQMYQQQRMIMMQQARMQQQNQYIRQQQMQQRRMHPQQQQQQNNWSQFQQQRQNLLQSMQRTFGMQPQQQQQQSYYQQPQPQQAQVQHFGNMSKIHPQPVAAVQPQYSQVQNPMVQSGVQQQPGRNPMVQSGVQQPGGNPLIQSGQQQQQPQFQYVQPGQQQQYNQQQQQYVQQQQQQMQYRPQQGQQLQQYYQQPMQQQQQQQGQVMQPQQMQFHMQQGQMQQQQQQQRMVMQPQQIQMQQYQQQQQPQQRYQ